MSQVELVCGDDRRRDDVRAKGRNGIDYIEVELFDAAGQPRPRPRLRLYFLGKAPTLRAANIVISGGRRVRNIQVVGEPRICDPGDPRRDACVTFEVDKLGDASVYSLCLVAVDERGRTIKDDSLPGRIKYRPLDGFDPLLACIDFTFRAGCPSDLDCAAETPCPPDLRAAPDINYLAKDYASFRQLILDRLAVLLPDWKERHIPDLGITLVEVLAYAADYLSYYQDAVATEAYLDTARQRISVRRHARLVDYLMHEGCNARAFVFVETQGGKVTLLPADTAPPDGAASLRLDDVYFVTRLGDLGARAGAALTEDDLRQLQDVRYEVFEPLVQAAIRLRPAHNRINFYTWGDTECCLPTGATAATLRDTWVTPPTDGTGGKGNDKNQTVHQGPPADAGSGEGAERSRALDLKPGDLLLFEEVKGARSGLAADADPTHRHVVRLTRVTPAVDPLDDTPVLDIEWSAEDALPFPLCISAVGAAPDCRLINCISIARGNMVLVDHGGRRGETEPWTVPPATTRDAGCDDEGKPRDPIVRRSRFEPRLTGSPLTFAAPLPADTMSDYTSARAWLRQDPRAALPWVRLTEQAAPTPWTWTPRLDLLASGPEDRAFVVEIDNEGYADLRFGDGDAGRAPQPGATFTPLYRVGNGAAGNVGAEVIAHLVLRNGSLEGITLRPRNPLPAVGGTKAEPMAEVKLFAPTAFRRQRRRAITAADYAELAQADPRLQRAAAALRWTGSWYEADVAVDPLGSEEPGDDLLAAIETLLRPYRRIGHDLHLLPAEYVSLDVALTVCVKPHYLRGHVKAALLDVFSNRVLADGRRGFFHPDNLSFGEGIYLSKLVAAAQAVAGVESVTVDRLARLDEASEIERRRALVDGVLRLSPFEVARLDNDARRPGNGKLTLTLKGGR